MKVHLGTDHAGFEFKEALKAHLTEAGFEVVDHGAHEYDALDDYPAFCIAAAQATVDDREAGLDSLGVVVGGSGNGEQMAANKVKGARAALAWNTEIAKLAREHNDAQIVSVGARQHSQEEAFAIVDAFLAEPFSGDERHSRRIGIMRAYEDNGTV
ncbi:ribose-5-phosphate isomerase [Brevibacterium samyangense]|uniref:Ribose-5-phosphate isomerase B n=1 Tax=Brevibacterium samyangense TaxID=366888 RepID=A0ABP5ERA0_9MICO